MHHHEEFYINGAWVRPEQARFLDVVNPATEQVIAKVAAGSSADVDKAVRAAQAAFPAYSNMAQQGRISLLENVVRIFKRRREDIAQAITLEMGCPISASRAAQVENCLVHLEAMTEILKNLKTSRTSGANLVCKEPIGVVGLITPWNWPTFQVVLKVMPALAVGCTVVLKPSEITPLDALIFAEIIHEAGFPPGVFNLINGDGLGVGEAMTNHPDIDMISFTGSTKAGVRVSKASADTVKRVALELGGKSANIICDDADFESAVVTGVEACFFNSGQSCDAPTRMLVPKARVHTVLEIARKAAEQHTVGLPGEEGSHLGPVANALQFSKIQELIQAGIDEGAELVTGGVGRPSGLNDGYFIKPTIFFCANNEFRVAQEEIFGPVLCIIPYEDDADAVAIANDSPYGLAAYVSTPDTARACTLAAQLRAGSIFLNYPAMDPFAPFGGYKQSGNGRESGPEAFDEYLEIKTILGHSV